MLNASLHTPGIRLPHYPLSLSSGLWALVHGEWMAWVNHVIDAKEKNRANNARGGGGGGGGGGGDPPPQSPAIVAPRDPTILDPTNLGCCGRPLIGGLDRCLHAELPASSLTNSSRYPRCSAALGAFVCLSVAAFACLVAALASPALRFSVVDNSARNATPVIMEFSLVSLGHALNTAAAEGSVSGESVHGAAFLSVVYYAVVVVCPLFVALMLVGTSMFSLGGRGVIRETIVVMMGGAANAVCCFASLDVFLLSAVVTLTEYGHLVSAIGGGLIKCGGGDDQITAAGEVLHGTWLAVAASVALWFACVLNARVVNAHAVAEERSRGRTDRGGGSSRVGGKVDADVVVPIEDVRGVAAGEEVERERAEWAAKKSAIVPSEDADEHAT